MFAKQKKVTYLERNLLWFYPHTVSNKIFWRPMALRGLWLLVSLPFQQTGFLVQCIMGICFYVIKSSQLSINRASAPSGVPFWKPRVCFHKVHLFWTEPCELCFVEARHSRDIVSWSWRDLSARNPYGKWGWCEDHSKQGASALKTNVCSLSPMSHRWHHLDAPK